jgi:hypothetical protein
MTYIIESQHTKEECLNSLDKLDQSSSSVLDNCYFACSSGRHEAFCVVDASSESDAKRMFAGLERCNVIPVEKYSSDQIRSFHEGETGSGRESQTM